jgi:hypothetical protein
MLSGDWTDAEKFTIVNGYVVLRNTGSYASAAVSRFTIEEYIDMKIIPLSIRYDYAKKTKKTSSKPPFQLPLIERWPLTSWWARKYSPVYYRSVIKEFYTIPITYTRDEINCSSCGCLHTEDGDKCSSDVIDRRIRADVGVADISNVITEFYTIPITYIRRTHDEINCSFCGCLHTEDGDECGDCVIARNTAVDYTLKWMADTDNRVKLFWLADLIRHYNITRGISIIREGNNVLYIWYIDNTNMWASKAAHYYFGNGWQYYLIEDAFKIAKPKRPVNRLDKSWKHTI